jgi:hypothetical protein
MQHHDLKPKPGSLLRTSDTFLPMALYRRVSPTKEALLVIDLVKPVIPASPGREER